MTIQIGDPLLCGVAGITTGGATPSGKIQNYISGNFVSDGSGSDAYKLYMDGTLTGFVGDTVRLTGVRLSNKITTQTAVGNIGSICQLFLTEPDITDNLNGDIIMAATIHIHDAPTEGVTNAAIYIGTGSLLLNGAGISDFRTGAADGDYIQFLAIDDDGAAGATLEVARMFSASDPYFSMGGSQENKFYNSGASSLVRVKCEATAYTASGAIGANVGTVELNQSGSSLAMTLADPGDAGYLLTITQIDTGTQGHTVTAGTAGAFNGVNAVATFNAQYETLVLVSVSSIRWVVVENIGAVAFSG